MLVQEMSFSEFYDTKAPKGEYHNFTVDEYCATVVNWDRSQHNSVSEKMSNHLNLLKAG